MLSMLCRCAWTGAEIRDAMRTRRETVEHPFGTLKMPDAGATHFLAKTLPKVATWRWRCTCSPTTSRACMNIVGIKPFLAAIRA